MLYKRDCSLELIENRDALVGFRMNEYNYEGVMYLFRFGLRCKKVNYLTNDLAHVIIGFMLIFTPKILFTLAY